jgi:hypothetical protein
MIKFGKIKKINLRKACPYFEREKQKALIKIGDALVEELFILSSGEAVRSVTGALRRSIFMTVIGDRVEVGFDVQKAPHARKFVHVVQLAWDNVYNSSVYKKIMEEFKLKAFR